MGARGPKPLPANVHLLKGNPSKIPFDQLGDSVDPVIEVPGVPKHLWPEARKEWRRISALLLENRLVSKLDRSALALYCQWWAKWVWAEEQFTRAKNLATARRQAHIDAAVKRAVAVALADYDLAHAAPEAAPPGAGDPNAGAQALDAGKPETVSPSPDADTTPALPAPDPIERQAIADAAAADAALEAEAGWTGGDGLTIPTPNGGVMYSPHWVASRQASQHVDKFLASFGLSPSARGRVSPSNNRQGTLPLDGGGPVGGFSDL